MIRIEILTIFLTMPLSVAIMQVMNAPMKTVCSISVFLYFVINSIRFFHGDVHLIDDLAGTQKADRAASHNAFSFFFGIASKFCFLLAAYYVTNCTAFFAFNGLCFLFDIFWLAVLRHSVDPNGRRGKHLLGLFKSWLILDSIEALLSFGMSIAVYKLGSDPQLKEYLEIGTIGVLVLLLFIDYLFNTKHYFQDRDKGTTKPSTATE